MVELSETTHHQTDMVVWSISLLGLMTVVTPAVHAQAAPNPVLSFPSPMPTDLQPLDDPDHDGQEHITVLGRRPFGTAPLPAYGNGRAPWETDTAIRDTMTGANTASFGNAYNLGSPLGSDERSNETGGQFVAPRHD